MKCVPELIAAENWSGLGSKHASHVTCLAVMETVGKTLLFIYTFNSIKWCDGNKVYSVDSEHISFCHEYFSIILSCIPQPMIVKQMQKSDQPLFMTVHRCYMLVIVFTASLLDLTVSRLTNILITTLMFY